MKKQIGMTLIEIMVSLLLGLIVLGATINIYIATVGSSSNVIRSARLNHDLDAVMMLMVNDIKRAGYWGGAILGANSRNNPFTAATTNIQIPTATCILYSYDANASGALTPADLTDDVDANEYYGFRLTNNSIQMRKTGTTTADCTNGTWEEFIDNNQLRITNLQFSFAPVVGVLPAASRCINVTNPTDVNCAAPATNDNLAEKRIVNIQLTGQLLNEAAVTKTINRTVVVRNSRLCRWNGTACI
ncbi:MAG: prepilin-type N-terminal cleavage/methylation domain-containing protein [Methylobacter sp.]|nr:prepilin-type N-terminal cleavage/methylation domain-containing protein [Methylobacter sp.]MDP2099515.1 prepilin-type N-terminal cleavage/methylation domain-containing protein [Methylobacter sp.]MDP2428673.1 prepilin-type N-terminal cleavage/methylation domain-containing protein [Methylobacter sp.]MDP3055148.1 prepilin-type N-terminal cleavage/methylation domain-containing protein [Methylobacter sp.]MDP3364219.1 prepilin-type N-terminal cleavage/methylation domain-containing protein [Methylo